MQKNKQQGIQQVRNNDLLVRNINAIVTCTNVLCVKLSRLHYTGL
uniref:Uncharacterized protein n=1 Tax=Arundo donax TaxID=35708 RepID=A0A0A9BSH5_ARUDO